MLKCVQSLYTKNYMSSKKGNFDATYFQLNCQLLPEPFGFPNEIHLTLVEVCVHDGST